MERNLEKLISKYLKLNNAYFDPRHLNLLLSSHPDPNGITSITDTLDDLGIPNAAIEIGFDDINLINKPILSLVYLSGRNQYVIIESVDEKISTILDEKLNNRILPTSELLASWQNIAFLIEPKQINKYTNILGLKNYLNLYLTIIGITGLLFLNQVSLLPRILGVLSILGLLASVFAIQIESKIPGISDRFCIESSSINCHAVVSSIKGRLFGFIKFSDLSLIYFGTMLSLFIFTNKLSFPFILTLDFFALSIIPFSINYQWRIIKKWCTICLFIILILLLQVIILLFFHVKIGLPSWYIVAEIVLLSILLLGLNLVSRQLLNGYQMAVTQEIDLLRFKRNPDLFLGALNRSQSLEISSFKSPAAYGNPAAPVQLIVFSNLFCSPCAHVHNALNAAIQKHTNDIYIQYCFHFDLKNPTDQRTKASADLIRFCLSASEEETQQALNIWYANKTIALPQTHIDKSLIESVLIEFYNFRIANNINMTPQIIINGKKAPALYDVDSLIWLLPYLIDEFTKSNLDNSNILLQQNSHSRNSPLLFD